MGVPNTTTFELQDVVDEVNPTTDDLVDCFADAVASKFDSSYEGSKNQLLNFRNYGAVSNTSFLSGTGQSDFKFVCSQTINTTKYHNGSGTTPAAGDTVYDNNSVAPPTTGNGYYSVGSPFAGPSGYYRITGGSGVVASTGSCSP
tara:strand:- start:31 stop:465 length:435 start_codon:yes stop_codon:yes gene_type:complete